jgi:hypothetical protein
MKLILALSILLLSITSQANIVNKTGHSSLNINTTTVNGEDYLQFEYCQAGTECRNLGPKDQYKRRDLIDQRFEERMEVGYSLVADVGLGIAGLWAGLSAGIAYGIGVSATFIAGGTTAVAIPTVSSTMIDSLNPAEQYREASTLSDTVLNNDQISLDSEDDLTSFVKRLERVLNQ